MNKELLEIVKDQSDRIGDQYKKLYKVNTLNHVSSIICTIRNTKNLA